MSADVIVVSVLVVCAVVLVCIAITYPGQPLNRGGTASPDAVGGARGTMYDPDGQLRVVPIDQVLDTDGRFLSNDVEEVAR